MYAAISGLDANETMLNVTANNLANVNTIGYKSQRVTFADSLSQIVRGASGPTTSNGGTNPMQVGLGVVVASTDNEMTEGSCASAAARRRPNPRTRPNCRPASSTPARATSRPTPRAS
jgi:flagellar hook protein FlgE